MSKAPIKNRVKEHRLIKASELLSNEKNYRTHPERQKKILTQNLQEIGHARSLTAYETPQGLRLIDGHLRKDIDPNAMLPVEILDVTEQEANVLLLTLDPLAALAETDSKILEELLKATPTTGELEAFLKEQATNAGILPPDFSPSDMPSPLDTKPPVTCPGCGHVFTP